MNKSTRTFALSWRKVYLNKFLSHPRTENYLFPLQFVTAISKNILKTTSMFGNSDSIFRDLKL